MKKILLIENRPERMKLLTSAIPDESLTDYSFLEIKTGADFDKIKNTLTNERLEVALKGYDVIISHRSAFDDSILNKLKNFCNENKCILILFSGSITESFLLNDGFPLLSMNSRLLYSKNLFLFLKEYSIGSIQPAILQYGTNWQISFLLALRDKINHLLLSKSKSDKAYVLLENNLKIALKSSPFSLEINSAGEEMTEQILRELKENIADKINNIFAFEL